MNFLIVVALALCCYNQALAAYKEYHFQDVSALDESTALSGGETYNKYSGEFYYGPLYGDDVGDGVRYNFSSLALVGTTKYMLPNSLPEDPSSLDWESTESLAVTLSDLLTPVELMFAENILLKTEDDNRNVLYNSVSISPVTFDVTTDSCLDDTVELTVLTSRGLPVADEAGVKFLIIGGDDCGMLDVTSSSPSIVINKTECGLGYDIEFNFVIVTGSVVDDKNSQQFNLICFHNMDNITVQTGNITDVDVPVTDLQSLSEWAQPTMRFVNPLNNDQIITEAAVGENVRLLIQIPEEYRLDFDVKVIDCWMGDLYFIQEGETQIEYVQKPNEDEQGVVYMDVSLFRPVDHNDSYRLNIMCAVETCVGSCAINRKKRFALNSNYYNTFWSHHMMYKMVEANLIEH